MSETHLPIGNWDDAGRYQIRLKGHLAARWAAWFDGLTVSQDGDGTTVIQGLVVDQAALHGLLQRVRDIGLPLISIVRIDPDRHEMPTTDPRQFTTHNRRTT